MILSLLKGIGNAIMHPKVAPMLSHFMKQYYDERDKFSNTETRIMCLLLEVCILLLCLADTIFNLRFRELISFLCVELCHVISLWWRWSSISFTESAAGEIPRYMLFVCFAPIACYLNILTLINVLGHCFFQLDATTSDDPAYIEPCISVLNKLNSQFYTGLQNEVKVLLAIQLLFYILLLSFRISRYVPSLCVAHCDNFVIG